MLGGREARGKSIHSVKKTLDLHEMDSLPLATCRRSAGNDNRFYVTAYVLIHHHGADGFSFVHQVERIVDAFERHFVSDEIVDGDSALHIPVDNLGNIGAASRAAEGGAFP